MYIIDTKIDKRLNVLKDELSSLALTYLHNAGNKITQNKRLKMKGAVSCFLLNTFYKCLRNINSCGITLDRNHYSKTLIINGRSTNRKVSYTYTRILIDFLSAEGYVNFIKGGVEEYGMVKGKWCAIEFNNSYIEFKDKLKVLYNAYNHEQIIEPTKQNVLIVHDIEGNDVTFRMNNQLSAIKTKLEGYNELSIDISVSNIDGSKHYDVQLHKILNGKSYKRGGRNYMSGEGIQNLSKAERKKLTINGKQTVIYDYQGFEPSIAYAMCQEIYQEDPYLIDMEGFDKTVSRKLCKLFLLIMFNIKDPKYLHNTLNEMIRSEFNLDKLYEQGKIPDKRIDTKMLVNLIEEKHYLIKHMFYGNFHTEPAYIGSLIADYIIDYFTQRGICVLPVFDEFIIDEAYEEELVDVMVSAYEYVLGFSDNAKIRKEK